MKYFLGVKNHKDYDKRLLNDQIANRQFDLNKDKNPFFLKYINDRLKSDNWISEQ